MEASDGSIWIGTYDGGIYILDESGIQPLDQFPEIRFSVIYCMYEDRRGWIWVGTDAGLYSIAGGRIIKQTISEGFEGAIVKNILEDRKNRIWFATSQGVAYYQSGKFTTYTTDNGLPGNNFRSLYEDSYGSIWAGTYGSGMALIKEDTAIGITRQHGLFDNIVSTFQEDNSGFLWMTCNKGAFKTNLNDLYELAQGKRESIQCYAYDQDEGIANPEFNGGCQPSSAKTDEGHLLFPSIGGLVVCYPDEMETNKEIPNVFIERILVDQVEQNLNMPIQVPPRFNDLRIEYTTLSFQDSKNIKFRFTMEGLDEEWSNITNRRTWIYKHIPPGTYDFRVIASNNAGVWNTTGDSVTFNFAGFWYQNTRLIVYLSIVLILIILLVVWLRINALKKRKALLEETVAERTKDLKEANETKDRFFSIIAHDLKSPFNSMLGFSDMLHEEYNELEDDERKSYIANIHQSAYQVYSLLENLLTWAGRRTGMISCNPVAIDMQELVLKNVALLSANAAAKEITLASDVKNGTIAYADSNMMDTVIRNLLSNAIKFTHQGGGVKVTGENSRDKSVIRIIDNGVGIPKEKISHLFKLDRQFRSKGTADEKGTGLGLLLVKEFIEKNNGLLEVKSEPGKGSTFKFTLPTSVK